VTAYTTRLTALNAQLLRTAAWWRPAPFHEQRPSWALARPDLAEATLALSAARVDTLTSDNEALWAWAGELMPDWRAGFELSRIPGSDRTTTTDTGISSWHIPGRKQAQIDAFASAVGEPVAPVLEWCSGKGHLGRRLAGRWGCDVLSLDHDACLCQEGIALAARAKVTQDFVTADALVPESTGYIAGRHAVALHACGDLHRVLLRSVAGNAMALDLVPCCYYRISSTRYRGFNPESSLPLSRDELHLAVTDSTTLGARDRRLRDEAMARKLGYLAWYLNHAGSPRQAGLKPEIGRASCRERVS
jgi:hypothetical protein